MLNSRKLFKALAVTSLLTLGSVASFAQQTCTTFATNVVLRPEGITENIGKIVVGGCNVPLPASYNILVQLPANFIITNGTGAAQQPVFTGTGTATYSYPAALPNALSISVTGGGGTDIALDGLRVNVYNAVNNGFAVGGQVNANIIITSGSTIISTTNPNPVVGTVIVKTLTYSVVGGNDATLSPAAGIIYTCSPTASGSVFGFLRFAETFGGALKVKAEEDGGVAGSATTGTRVRVSFAGLPAGISVLLPAGVITTGGNTLTYVSGLGSVDTSVTPGYSLAPGDVLYGGGYAPAGSGDVVYEVTGSQIATLDTLNIPFAVKYTAGPAIGIGAATSKGGLAPVDSTSFPRFGDVTTTANLLSTAICSTTLLFPYVTTDAGFDTGIAISNTSSDPRGTAAQAGTCSLNPYGAYSSGATLPAAGVTPTINGGRTWAFSLTDSTVFPSGAKLGSGFNGYLIAVCDFQLAHGYAFVSTYGLSGANSVAQGYLALVIPGGARTTSNPAGAENLNH